MPDAFFRHTHRMRLTRRFGTEQSGVSSRRMSDTWSRVLIAREYRPLVLASAELLLARREIALK